MRNKCHKWKCLFLALFVFCAGLCLETDKTVFGFGCASVLFPNAAIIVADNTFDEVQLCTVETAGAYQTARTQVLEAGLNVSKREVQSSFHFLYSDIFSLREEKISVNSAAREGTTFCCQEVIATYIHKADGKK